MNNTQTNIKVKGHSHTRGAHIGRVKGMLNVMHYALCRMLCRLHRPGRIHPLREARCISIDVSHPRIICIRISLRSPCITHALKIQTHTHMLTHTACRVHIVSFNKCLSQRQNDLHRNLSPAPPAQGSRLEGQSVLAKPKYFR